jgi:hypothetical protein
MATTTLSPADYGTGALNIINRLSLGPQASNIPTQQALLASRMGLPAPQNTGMARVLFGSTPSSNSNVGGWGAASNVLNPSGGATSSGALGQVGNAIKNFAGWQPITGQGALGGLGSLFGNLLRGVSTLTPVGAIAGLVRAIQGYIQNKNLQQSPAGFLNQTPTSPTGGGWMTDTGSGLQQSLANAVMAPVDHSSIMNNVNNSPASNAQNVGQSIINNAINQPGYSASPGALSAIGSGISAGNYGGGGGGGELGGANLNFAGSGGGMPMLSSSGGSGGDLSKWLTMQLKPV